MEKIKLTEKEEKLMKYWMEGGSDWNCDKFDITKIWQENHFEGEEWADIVYLERYNKLLGTNNAGSRGVLGSLQKKGLIKLVYDDGGENAVTWIFIGEKEFNNIKSIFGAENKESIVETKEDKIEKIKEQMKLSEEAIKKEQQKIRALKIKMLKQELLDLQKEMEEEQNPNRDTIVFGEYQIMKEIVELWQNKEEY